MADVASQKVLTSTRLMPRRNPAAASWLYRPFSVTRDNLPIPSRTWALVAARAVYAASAMAFVEGGFWGWLWRCASLDSMVDARAVVGAGGKFLPSFR